MPRRYNKNHGCACSHIQPIRTSSISHASLNTDIKMGDIKMVDFYASTVGQKTIVVSAFVVLLWFIVTRIQRIVHERKLLPLPPSPPGNVLVGNLLDVQTAAKSRSEHILYQKWAQELGPLYRVRNGFDTLYELSRPTATQYEKSSADKLYRQGISSIPTMP